MPNYSFFGSYVKGATQDTLASNIAEFFKINIVPESKRDAVINSMMKADALEEDEVAVYCREGKGIVLFFHDRISTDWMEVVANTNTTELSKYGIGKFDTAFSKGFIKFVKNGYNLSHITQTTGTLKFPITLYHLPPEEQPGGIGYWIDDVGMDAMGVRIKQKLFQADNGNTPIKIFRFNASASFFKELEADLTQQAKFKKEEKLRQFRDFVAARSNVGAAFESNKNDKVIYQFLSNDYELLETLKKSYFDVGKYHERDSLIDILLHGDDATVIHKIEEIAQNVINVFELFDFIFYTGLYHTSDKVRAHALGLALFLPIWDLRPNFWHLWKKDFYAKKIMLPYIPGHEFVHTVYAKYATRLLQDKYLPKENKEFNSIKISDADYKFEGSFFKYFDEIVIEDNVKLIEDETHFINTLHYFGTTIKSLKITGSALQYLHPLLETMPLIKLDVSDNPIESVDYLKFGKLQELTIRNTSIKSISLKDLPALKKIVLDNLTELDNLHLVDIGNLSKDFHFEVSKKEGPKTYFNFKKQEFDPFNVPAPKPFWKIW